MERKSRIIGYGFSKSLGHNNDLEAGKVILSRAYKLSNMNFGENSGITLSGLARQLNKDGLGDFIVNDKNNKYSSSINRNDAYVFINTRDCKNFKKILFFARTFYFNKYIRIANARGVKTLEYIYNQPDPNDFLHHSMPEIIANINEVNEFFYAGYGKNEINFAIILQYICCSVFTDDYWRSFFDFPFFYLVDDDIHPSAKGDVECRFEYIRYIRENYPIKYGNLVLDRHERREIDN